MSGCSLVKRAAGADIDPVAFLKAREARISEVKLREGLVLVKRLGNKDPIDNADFVFTVNGSLLGRIASQFVGVSGRLDDDNSFVVDSVALSVHNGYCLASLRLKAENHSYGVSLNLFMDCLAVLEYSKNELLLRLEPFNISPEVSTGFLLSGLKETIGNLVMINLGDLGSKFNSLKVPLNFEKDITIEKTEYKVRELLNADITIPEKKIFLRMTLKEVLFLEGRAVIALNLSNRKGG